MNAKFVVVQILFGYETNCSGDFSCSVMLFVLFNRVIKLFSERDNGYSQVIHGWFTEIWENMLQFC